MKMFLQAMYNYMKSRLYIIFLLLLLSSCSKESIEVCGYVTSGYSDYDLNGMPYYYLYIDGDRHRVDQKTYESYFINDLICLQ